MYATMLTVISYLCTIFGLAAAAGYGVTFYLLDYNQLYLAGQSGYDDTDLPYTYAIVECVTAGFTLIIGVLAFSTTGRPTRKAVLVALFFFGAACILEGTFGMLRAWNLGLVGDDMEKTCSDVGQATGCPTTRFEHVHDREILYAEPSGGDCTFWFWGNKPADADSSSASMPRLIDMIRDGGTLGPDGRYLGLDPREVEKYMDWSRATSYGWRDDPEELSKIGADNDQSLDNLDALNLKKVHNMQEIMTLQNSANNGLSGASKNILEADELTQAPSISYCWYWGCNRVCHNERYLVNRLWLGASVTLFAVQLANLILAAMIYRRTPTYVKLVRAVAQEDMSEDLELMAPLRGRRKRQLHPSETTEDNWTVFRHEDDVYLVDKLTLSVMAEHESELMTRQVDEASDEPAIVSVRLTPFAKQ